jgi:hypothetical protein
MRTGPRKLPAKPQSSGSSLSPCALHSTAENRHFFAVVPARDFSIIPQKHLFFKQANLIFRKKCAKKACFIKHLTEKTVQTAQIPRIKRPDACTPHPEPISHETHGPVYICQKAEHSIFRPSKVFGFSPVYFCSMTSPLFSYANENQPILIGWLSRYIQFSFPAHAQRALTRDSQGSMTLEQGVQGGGAPWR